MNVNAVWAPELARQIVTKKMDELEAFVELLSFLKESEIETILDEDGLYADSLFCDWIYSQDVIECNDVKRELQIYISRSCHREAEEVEMALCKIGENRHEKTVGLAFLQKKFYAFDTPTFYMALRGYLAAENRDEFEADMPLCFPDIYFDASVGPSLGTLNRKFEEIREEIVVHLSALNDYRKQFSFLLTEGCGYREISETFRHDTGIECSPQADREDVRLLERSFKNEETGSQEKVVCEMHTKFHRFNIDKTKQDRIYFAPGKRGIHQGKVIVVHIGKHLGKKVRR